MVLSPTPKRRAASAWGKPASMAPSSRSRRSAEYCFISPASQRTNFSASRSNAFAQTSLPARGESFETLLHYIYATATRLARERLEAAGELPPWPEHDDGSRWVWWAEEPLETEVL
jgi:hypothetical protein